MIPFRKIPMLYAKTLTLIAKNHILWRIGRLSKCEMEITRGAWEELKTNIRLRIRYIVLMLRTGER